MCNPSEEIGKILEKERETCAAVYKHLTSDQCNLPYEIKSHLINNQPLEYYSNGFIVCLKDTHLDANSLGISIAFEYEDRKLLIQFNLCKYSDDNSIPVLSINYNNDHKEEEYKNAHAILDEKNQFDPTSPESWCLSASIRIRDTLAQRKWEANEYDKIVDLYKELARIAGGKLEVEYFNKFGNKVDAINARQIHIACTCSDALKSNIKSSLSHILKKAWIYD